MDFTVGKSWYNERKSSLSTETSHAKRRVKGKEVAGAQSNTILLTNVEPPTATNNPTPSRLRPTHVPLLESIASQAEQSRDEENDIIKQASLRSTKMIQQPDNEDQKLHQKFPMEMTFEQAMKNYSPPTKRSRWADMFESRRFDRIATPPSFFSLSSRKTSPPSLLSSFSRRMSPSNSNAVAGSDVVAKQKPTSKKTSASDDSKRFRAFLARSDGAVPFFMSPTGTHQQFFPSGVSERRRPSNISRGSNNSRPANTSHALLHSHSFTNASISRGSMNSSQASRSINTNMDSSRTSSLGGTMWSLMDGSVDSLSQVTDHTRMSSASGSFSYHPSIPEDKSMFHDASMLGPEHGKTSCNQATPDMLISPDNNINQGMMSLSMTSVPPPTVPMVMAPESMIITPAPMIMNNIVSPIPDLSHLVKQFRPTNMLLREKGMIPDNSRQDTNYEGDDNHPDLLGLPDSINCCMWIINIPPEVQHGEFMRILDCGAVAALSMVKPQGNHKTQAAKATFKKVVGGAELFSRARRGQGLRIRRNKIKVWYNDYGAYEWRGPETRFLEIEAPAVLDENFWQSYFENWCKYVIISISPLPCAKPGFASTRFEFVRIAGQAQTCFQAIQKDEAFLGQVKVQYGLDPFDV